MSHASTYHPGQPRFCEDRWKAIMRTRAMDNQLCMVVARNNAEGSCVVDRKGDILAWNGGNRPWISATVTFDDGYRIWNGAHHRDVCWVQRRPHLYRALSESWRFGSLDGEQRGTP